MTSRCFSETSISLQGLIVVDLRRLDCYEWKNLRIILRGHLRSRWPYRLRIARLLFLSLRNLLGACGVVLLLICGVRLYPVSAPHPCQEVMTRVNVPMTVDAVAAPGFLGLPSSPQFTKKPHRRTIRDGKALTLDRFMTITQQRGETCYCPRGDATECR